MPKFKEESNRLLQYNYLYSKNIPEHVNITIKNKKESISKIVKEESTRGASGASVLSYNIKTAFTLHDYVK